MPNSFGTGVTAPIIRDKTCNVNNVDNYRGITLLPVSKPFQVVILAVCIDAFQTVFAVLLDR